MTARPLWPAVLIGWALTATVLLAASAASIRLLEFPDPDDAMRLLEVRDLLGGQSWWDVGQHRLAAGAMHWSRLVDLPIAAVILAVAPLLGVAQAERAALLIVPLATLLLVIVLGAHLTRRMLDDERAQLAVLIAPLSIPLLHQLRPLRIDHHGWQIALALAALYLLVGRPTLKNGLLMGAALAALISVSLEGAPIAVALAGLSALAWAFQPQRRAGLLVMVWSFWGCAVLLQLATRGSHYVAPMCDAVTTNLLLALGAAALGVTLATFTERASTAVRIAALAAAGCTAIAVLLTRSPECVAGTFAQLDPLTRQLWYERVFEGLPIWKQFPSWAIMTIGLPVVGLIGSAIALRAAAQEDRTKWLLLIASQSAATFLAVMIQRAGGTANAFALPGAAFALGAMLIRARGVTFLPRRIGATAAALLVASPGLVAFLILGVPESSAVRAAQQRYAGTGRPVCSSSTDARSVGRLPAGMLFAPLDISPDIIVATHHRAVVSGYHRNGKGIHDVMAAFTGTPSEAHVIVEHYRARYVVVCPGMNEPELYRQQNSNGFWARLERGERFPWLQPVPVMGSPVLIWRVLD